MSISLRIHDAIIFATLKHQKQKRKGTEIPYIVHPMEVMKIMIENELPEDVIIAGILNDTLEDTDTKPEEIEAKFGKAVLNIVLTESEDKSKTWRERKQHTIDCLKNDSMETKLVCCADKLSNCRSMYADLQECGEKLWDRFNASKEDIKWYYESIVNALSDLANYKMYKEIQETVKAVFGSKKFDTFHMPFEYTCYREKTKEHIYDTMLQYDDKDGSLSCSDWSYWKSENDMSSDDREYYLTFPKKSYKPLLEWLKTVEGLKPLKDGKYKREENDFLLKCHDKELDELFPYLTSYFVNIKDAEGMNQDLPKEIESSVSVWH